MDLLKYLRDKLPGLKSRVIKASPFKKILLALIVIALGWSIMAAIKGATAQKPQYQTSLAEVGNIISTVSESGSISAVNQVNVTSPSDGIIIEAYVTNGDTVNAGDSLFKVKATATPAQKASAYASYLSAQNTLNSAQAKMNSLQSAAFKANQKFMTDAVERDLATNDPLYIQENADWLQAEADYKNQAGVIAQAQASYNSAALSFQATQDAVVAAPVSGTVANFSTGVGSSVSAGSSSSSSSTSSSASSSGGSAVLVLGDFSKLMMNTQVSEMDVSKMKAGQKATITIDAFPDKTFVGNVSSVDTIGTSSSGVVTYNVYIELIAPPSDIRPGMTASAVVQIERKDSVVKVPTSSVQTASGQSYVRILKDGKMTQVPVEVGLASDSETEILSGVSEGDTVITSVVTNTATSTRQSSSPFGGINRGFGGGGNRVMISR